MKEQTFFSDPAIDRIMNVVLGLAAELHTVRTKCHALEDLLVKGGVISATAVEAWTPSPEIRAVAEQELQASVKGLIDACLGVGAGSERLKGPQHD